MTEADSPVRKMTELETDLSHAGSAVIDGKPTRALAVLAKRDQNIAVWIADSLGEPCGAWSLNISKKDQAQTAVQILERRAFFSIDRDTLYKDLTDLAEAAEATAHLDSLANYVCDLNGLFRDLQESREQMEASLEREKERVKAKKLKRAELSWPSEIPARIEPALKAALKSAGIRPSGTSIEAEAIDTVRLISWVVRMWHGSEIMKTRRSYIGADLGAPVPLPQSWSQPMVLAYQSPLVSLGKFP